MLTTHCAHNHGTQGHDHSPTTRSRWFSIHTFGGIHFSFWASMLGYGYPLQDTWMEYINLQLHLTVVSGQGTLSIMWTHLKCQNIFRRKNIFDDPYLCVCVNIFSTKHNVRNSCEKTLKLSFQNIGQMKLLNASKIAYRNLPDACKCQQNANNRPVQAFLFSTGPMHCHQWLITFLVLPLHCNLALVSMATFICAAPVGVISSLPVTVLEYKFPFSACTAGCCTKAPYDGLCPVQHLFALQFAPVFELNAPIPIVSNLHFCVIE